VKIAGLRSGIHNHYSECMTSTPDPAPLTLMDWFPVVITVGAALLGWIAGGMLLTDPAMPAEVAKAVPYANYVFAAVGAVFVVVIGKMIASRQAPVAVQDVSAPRRGQK
jgi:hypothetical protein